MTKLAEALTLLSPDRVRRIACEVTPDHHDLPLPMLLGRIEASVLSPSHVQLAITRRRPPVLSLLTELLRSGGRMSIAELRERVLAHAETLCKRVTSGELLARPGSELYRRVLMEAWRSDLSIDPSEAAILGVLRHELGMSQVEHFLATHHRDVRSYWDDGDPFGAVTRALEDAGILYQLEGELVLPEDLFPAVRVALGVPLNEGDARRLFERLSGSQTSDALKKAGLKTSGSKSEKVERLIEHWIDPYAVLGAMHIWSLQELCARTGDRKTGSKEELIARVVERHSRGLDQVDPASLAPVPEVEEKALTRAGFAALFGVLTAAELAAILWRFKELRQSGSKDRRVATLWESPFCEATLLGKLKNSDVARVLERVGARRNGSKEERVERLIGHFRRDDVSAGMPEPESLTPEAWGVGPAAPVPAVQEVWDPSVHEPLLQDTWQEPAQAEPSPSWGDSFVGEAMAPDAPMPGVPERGFDGHVPERGATPPVAPVPVATQPLDGPPASNEWDSVRSLVSESEDDAPRDSIDVDLETALPEPGAPADQAGPNAPLPRQLEDPTENWLMSEDSRWGEG